MKIHIIACAALVIIQSIHGVHKQKQRHKILSRQQYVEQYAWQQEKIRVNAEQKQEQSKSCPEFEASLGIFNSDTLVGERAQWKRWSHYNECLGLIGETTVAIAGLLFTWSIVNGHSPFQSLNQTTCAQ